MANTVHVGAQSNHQAAAAKVKGGRGGKKGGGRKGGGGNPIARQARQQVAFAETPIRQQIKAERAANLAKAQAQMGFSKAAAAIMQNAAPAVGDAYTNAANADAGYSRGLGSGVQAQLDQNQQQSNQFLQQMGTPQGALHSAAPVGDMSYGLQGYIPATTLQREGAGWESAAQLAPGNELHAGQQLAQQTLANDPQLASLQGELAKVAATEPDVYNKLLTTYNEQAYRRASLAQGQQRINLTAQRDAVLASQGQQRIALEGARLQQSIRQSANSNAQAWARIGISNKRLRMEMLKSEAKLKGGGFTPDELVHIKSTAANMAENLRKGGFKSDGSPDPRYPPKSYKAAFKYMVAHGIPASIAYGELKSAGYKVPAKMSDLQRVMASLAFNPQGATSTKAQQSIVNLAHQYIGTPYVYGGESPKGFDCSGFAQFLYAKAGISIPRTTYTQWTTGHSVPKRALAPGDLVFFKGSDSKGGLPGHVGIYIGDGMMIDAPHTGSNVRIESVWNFGGYMGARRYGNA